MNKAPTLPETPVNAVADRWHDPAILESPFAYLDELRSESPVFFSSSLNAYMVTRYADVIDVLRRTGEFASQLDGKGSAQANFSAEFAGIYEKAGVPVLLPTLQSTDGEVHRRYRAAVDATFNASAVRKLEADVERRIHALIDAFIDAGKTDIYTEFCMHLPLQVICDLTGVPLELTPLLRASASAMVRLVMPALETPESLIQLHRDQAEFQKAILSILAELRAHPDDDKLLSRLQRTPTIDGSHLTDQEVMSLMTVLNVGGNETTTNGFGNMFQLCFANPDLEPMLRNDRKLIDKFVEECLRLESPVSCLPRRATADTQIAGVRIPQDSIVMVNYAAANRDESRFACPARLDVARPGIRNHIAFGAGAHFCLGAMLSRMELARGMNIILDRMENIRLDPSQSPPTHDLKLAVRGFHSLPICFDRR